MSQDLASLAAKAESLIGVKFIIKGRRAYHYAAETRRWYRVTKDDLRYAKHAASEYPRDAYSHWCAGISCNEMPRNWSPY